MFSMGKNIIKLQEELLKSIDLLIQERISNLGISYYLEGVIQSANLDSTYSTRINGEDFDIKTREGIALSVGDIVMICVPNGNFNNKFIDMKRL